MKDDDLDSIANQGDPDDDHGQDIEKPSSVIPAGENRSLDFEAWSEEPLPEGARTMVGRTSILKKEDIKQLSSRRITPVLPMEPESEEQSMEVLPVMEGETLIGLKIQCHCGATHEVRLDYDDDV